MKPSATAVRATKWLLINSLLSRGTITPQPDIRNEGCFIPEASGDQQMATGMASGRCGAFDVKNIFWGNFQTLSRAFKKLHENIERTEERKTKTKELDGQRRIRTRKHTANTRGQAGLLMSAQDRSWHHNKCLVAHRINSLICLITELPISFPSLGSAQWSCAAPQHVSRLCSHYHIINKQEIHQGLIKGLYTTEGREREKGDGVCFSPHRWKCFSLFLTATATDVRGYYWGLVVIIKARHKPE